MDPWLVIGDFNAVIGTHETTSQPRSVSCDDFCAWVTICNLIDLDTQDSMYTWSGSHNGRVISSRLDQAFCNSLFLDYWSQIACLTLPRTYFDPFPLLLDCTLEISSGPKPFRFQGMWLSHPTFLVLVK